MELLLSDISRKKINRFLSVNDLLYSDFKNRLSYFESVSSEDDSFYFQFLLKYTRLIMFTNFDAVKLATKCREEFSFCKIILQKENRLHNSSVIDFLISFIDYTLEYINGIIRI